MHYLSPEDTFKYIPSLPNGILLEGGVYNGNYLSRIIKSALDQDCPFESVLGLDSFEGLPEEQEGLWLNKDWPLGAFNVKADYGLTTKEEAMNLVADKICEKLGTYAHHGYYNNEEFVKEWNTYVYSLYDKCEWDVNKQENIGGNKPSFRLRLVPGFFSETLTEKLANNYINEISYAHIDVDLYISTKQVLDWLFTYEIPKEGCLFRFDDWGSTPLIYSPEFPRIC